ncbi:MAG: HAD family hydrolase [Dehalococcoidia bacterium]
MAEPGDNQQARRLTIFLDDGGVMNDNDVRGPQWQRLVAEYLVPCLGGEHDRWAEANSIVAQRLWDEFAARPPDDSYAAYWADYPARWLKEMCEMVGIEAPDEGACIALSNETSAYVIPRVRSTYPGVVDAIRALNHSGHTLRTASGEPSDHLDGYLTGMGVRDCFAGALYGPDIVDTPKNHPAYYSRIFAHAAVVPANAVVVDNDLEMLANAAGEGATTVLISADGASAGGHLAIASLAALPALLQSWIPARQRA